MRPERHDDLVSTTAIVAGAVVGIAVTLMSLWAAGDESLDRSWTDPRAPERGPTELEWSAISTFKPIESMTVTEPGEPAVDAALDELRRVAEANPQNPFIQELYLKGLRVASYHSADGARRVDLADRFEAHASRAIPHELVTLEEMRMILQVLERSCPGAEGELPRLRALSLRHPSEQTAELWIAGAEAVRGC